LQGGKRTAADLAKIRRIRLIRMAKCELQLASALKNCIKRFMAKNTVFNINENKLSLY